ncbi:MAG: hypothetical protein HWD59_13595 [Coxiellaceae bacterium]|nr:MAG: hypothetical protein HWD59_13595 [Coxiellaceae bacterium]
MFAVIYRGYVKAGQEAEYKKLWNKIANYFVAHRGALGSCLHQTEEGMWLAYSRWPDKATRDASWPGENAPNSVLPEDIRQAINAIRDCLDQDRKLPEICMQVVDDLL